MKYITTFIFILFVLATPALAHHGVIHTEHHNIPIVHILHMVFLWGGIVAASIVVWRERKELFGKK